MSEKEKVSKPLTAEEEALALLKSFDLDWDEEAVAAFVAGYVAAKGRIAEFEKRMEKLKLAEDEKARWDDDGGVPF